MNTSVAARDSILCIVPAKSWRARSIFLFLTFLAKTTLKPTGWLILQSKKDFDTRRRLSPAPKAGGRNNVGQRVLAPASVQVTHVEDAAFHDRVIVEADGRFADESS